ncbi:pentapeptide repeat-containing protein [Streptomyces glaucus]|uniref:Pentapeptide repeat-containing protein n=1 Tax=Streptomyces glaucus TaxID=284029 RepID=A0ABP5WH39_9ACTN
MSASDEPQPSGWWRRNREQLMPELFIGLIFSVLVSGVFVGLQLFIEDRRSDRNEVLANVQYIRETVRDSPNGVKSFRNMNLRNADLSGLDFGCDITTDARQSGASGNGIGYREADGAPGVTWFARKTNTCADFSGADLTGATITDSDLTGADFSDATLDGAKVESSIAIASDFTRTSLNGTEFNNVLLLAANINVATGDFSINFSRLDGAQIGLDEGSAVLAGTSVTQLSAMTGEGSELRCSGGYFSFNYSDHPRFHRLTASPSKTIPVLCDAADRKTFFERECMARRYGVDPGKEHRHPCGAFSTLPGEVPSRISYEWNHYTKRDLVNYWNRILTAEPPIAAIDP